MTETDDLKQKNLENVFDEIDLADCIDSDFFILKKSKSLICRFKVAETNYFVTLLSKDEKVVGEMAFLNDVSNQSLFLIHLQNCSIDHRTRERKINGIGKTLIKCAKKIAKSINYANLRVTAQTPFSTPLPLHHNLVEFYKKQGFELESEKGSDFYGYRMKCIL